MLRLAACLIVLCALTACSASAASSLTDGPPTAEPTLEPTSTPMPASVEEETYAVYEVVFREEYNSTSVVLNRNNIECYPDEGTLEYVVTDLPMLELTTLDNFMSRPCDDIVAEQFHNDFKIHFLTESEFQLFFEEDDALEEQWASFYDAYPAAHGYVEISPVGFNTNGTQAIVYYENLCGGECGVGEYIVLEKKDGIWQIVGSLITWNS